MSSPVKILRKILLPVILLAGMIGLFVLVGKYLVYSDPLEAVDLIVVLSGNDESRVREAAALYKDGIAYNILLTSTGQTWGDYDFPYTALQRDMLIEMGIPEGGIYISELSAKNTGQEATGIINRMYDLGFYSALIVTDAWHTRRVKTIFTDSFGNTPFRVFVHPVPDSGYNKYFWWLSPEGWQHTVGEYVRLLGYIIKRDTNIPDYPNL
ncbi:MAG: YdcF family protein [Flexilinea sp.]|nr:YdcF family protein [Flexilinea sp.]